MELLLVAFGILPPRPTNHHALDTPSWRVNMTAQTPGCSQLRQWCGACCRDYAAHAGRGVAALRRLLTQPKLSMHIAVLGNSVARFHNFGVARGLVEELQRRSPSARISIEYAHVAGGFEPDHLFYCGLNSSSLLRADLVLMHYHAPRGGAVYEKIIRRLLALPRKPVVVCMGAIQTPSTEPDLACPTRAPPCPHDYRCGPLHHE